MITHRIRMENCLSGAPLDRAPVALWRHFPVDDQSPQRLSASVLNFQNNFNFDLVKVTPASSFCLKDWGAQDEWMGSTEGTRIYTKRVISQPEDWFHLHHLDPYQGYLGAQLVCLKEIISSLGPDMPVLQTIFSPLAQAKNLAGGDTLFVHLRRYPDAVKQGLQIIADTTRSYIAAVKELGAAGIFYAVQHAQYGLLSEAEFQVFGKYFDLYVLEEINGLWLNMVHLHGTDVMFDTVSDYPVQILNWHDRDTFPSLEKARSIYNGVLCGGLQREKNMVLGNAETVTAEARQAIEATKCVKFILGTGCVVPITAPYGNLMAARQSVEKRHV